MPKGGKRRGAGRKPGSRDRAAAEQVQSLSVLARKHGPEAISALAKIAKKGMSEAAQVSAATALLDRGYGRPMQQHEHSGEGGGPIKHNLALLSDEQLAQLEGIFGPITNARGSASGDKTEGGAA